MDEPTRREIMLVLVQFQREAFRQREGVLPTKKFIKLTKKVIKATTGTASDAEAEYVAGATWDLPWDDGNE